MQMQLAIFGVVCLIISIFVFRTASRLQKNTTDMLAGIRAEAVEADQKIAQLEKLEKQAVAAAAPVEPEDEPFVRLADGIMGRASEYETRGDGQLVRKDRWKVGFGNIVTTLIGSRSEYEIDDIVEKVRVIAEAARADYESGGNGVPGSAPVWGPCPANCNDGLVRSGQECQVCDGRAKVVIEAPTAAKVAPEAVPVAAAKEESPAE